MSLCFLWFIAFVEHIPLHAERRIEIASIVFGTTTSICDILRRVNKNKNVICDIWRKCICWIYHPADALFLYIKCSISKVFLIIFEKIAKTSKFLLGYSGKGVKGKRSTFFWSLQSGKEVSPYGAAFFK